MSPKNIVEGILADSIRAKMGFVEESGGQLVLLAERISQAFARDGKLLLCGNGGSAADAQHIAAEFVNRYELERPPLPALALTTDTSVLTSISNDAAFEEIFSKQIKALAGAADILLAFSTSGNSRNVIRAVRDAAAMGIFTAALLGGDGGEIAGLVDLPLIVRSPSTPRIQETHIMAGHILCHLVDYYLFQSQPGGAAESLE